MDIFCNGNGNLLHKNNKNAKTNQDINHVTVKVLEFEGKNSEHSWNTIPSMRLPIVQ